MTITNNYWLDMTRIKDACSNILFELSKRPVYWHTSISLKTRYSQHVQHASVIWLAKQGLIERKANAIRITEQGLEVLK
jgi:hypothetical protein